MQAKYFVLITHQRSTEGFKRGMPLGTQPVTLKEAQAKIAWQIEGGFSLEDYTICKASDVCGMMESLSGAPVALEKGCLTDAAIRSMHLALWGHLA